MEKLIHQMQDEKSGVPIRTVKSFMSKIPSVFTGVEIADEFAMSSYKMFGSISVSGQLCTYPSPNPTVTPTYYYNKLG